MPNEEVLGPRKTMVVLVIVVGCFAVLWPRILSPLIVGPPRELLEPNQFDRDAGCCDVMFEKEVAVLELVTAVCNFAIGGTQLSPYSVAECRRAVNDTCGVDIAAFLKRNENVGKSSRTLFEILQQSNSSCLREHFGVPVWTLGVHTPVSSWAAFDTVKQERPLTRAAGTHPALRERGRAIAASPPPPPRPTVLPPHVRVKSSPLSVYLEPDVKPPPIPGMRPPLGNPGGPMPAPKSSMGVIMPIYTICIIVFFAYTLSKLVLKRSGPAMYESVEPDPHFRHRVFRDNSRATPEAKLGHKERDARDEELEALRARLAETELAMQRIVSQLHKREADVQDDSSRAFSNGTVIKESTPPVRIVASQYRHIKEESPEIQNEHSPIKDSETVQETVESEPIPAYKEQTPDADEARETTTPELVEDILKSEDIAPSAEDTKDNTPEREPYQKTIATENDRDEVDEDLDRESREPTPQADEERESSPELPEANKQTMPADAARATRDFIAEAIEAKRAEAEDKKQSTPELLTEALRESGEEEEYEEDEEEEEVEEEEEMDHEKSTVKVVGMETTAHARDGGACPPPAPPAPPAAAPQARTHEAADVQSIYLTTEIPHQSKVLVTDCPRSEPSRHSPLVVSGKMTLSLIQDQPRDTPERDLESTVDDFTTASGFTQPNAEQKEDDLSDEEEEEEVEIEEIEELEEEEDDEDEDEEEEQLAPKNKN